MNMALTFVVIYIYQVDLSFFLGYIYVLEDGFKDLNMVNPKAAESLDSCNLEIKEDGLNVRMALSL